jgi:hypothetical protein
MGAWGTLSTPFRGKPKAPAERPYQGDPYFEKGGAGFEHGQKSDEAAFNLLQKYLGREPGYTAEEQKTMYDIPADQQKTQEQAALRDLNQGSAGAGSFGSGGRAAGRGALIGGGIRTRAGLKQNVIVAAAEAAMQDRIRQIQAASDYSSNRLGMTTNNLQGKNAYNMGLNQLDLTKWQTQLEQYNYDREKTREFIKMIVSSATGGGGG